jgi:hypothetical protein
LKNGLISENGDLIYYKDDKPYHAGVISVDGAIYYISSGGRAVKGMHIVHTEMTNGILKRGTYTFGDDYKLVKGSYIAPKKNKRRPKKSSSNPRKMDYKIRIKKFLQNKKNRAAIIVLAVFLVFLTILPFLGHNTASQPEAETPAQQLSPIVSPPTFTEDVLLCSKAAKLEYDGQIALSDAVESGFPYYPLFFYYYLNNTSGTLFLGEMEDLSDAREYPLAEEENYIIIDNLKVDTTYYYEIHAANAVYPGTFRTAPSTRFLYIPGLANVRDIGGGRNLDGKKVRQGLLIRGVELDGLVNAKYYIPEDKLADVQETFGFRYDFDLRSSSIYNGAYTSRLGVEHKFYDAPMYGGIFTETYYKNLRNIFTDLADPNKYPMYLHCTWGQDRTGTIVFLLQGILNMSERDMIREFQLTGYVARDIATSNNMGSIISGMRPYAGDTLQEKIVSFLITEIGVTEEQIESIRSIFLESE